MKDYRKNFIENLKLYMKEKNINHSELARHINVDHSTVSKWMSGKFEPKLTNICLMLEFFGCDFKDLIE